MGPRACFHAFMFAKRTHWRLTPNPLTQAIEEFRKSGRPMLDLTESNPTRCGFVYDSQEIIGALRDPLSLTYEPDPRGLLRARQAVAGYYAERGVKVDPRQIFLTTSTSEAYAYVFRLLADPGDNVLAPTPSYPLFDFLSRLNDLDLVPYPLVYDVDWQIDLRALEPLITSRTRALLVVHPNNPTGSFVHRQELEFLVGICERHSLALIADEVFSDYSLPSISSKSSDVAREFQSASGERVASHAAISGVLTFTLSGLSKICALPQMKLAWLVVNGPADLLSDAQDRLELIADTYLSVSAPLAHALPKLLEGRGGIQSQVSNRTQENLLWLDKQLSPDSLVRRLKASGGWYVILRLPALHTDEEWSLEFLRQDGVLVYPGHFYDFYSDCHVVLSLLPSHENFQDGVKKLLSRVDQLSRPQE
ncbi:MAG TPA: pyridoxal phosphate-dependent aminotransferase [Terriglobia bacterium]|nr:pyridoxal phosphate-dependent aminotransferase [Terriglobia bacterium]